MNNLLAAFLALAALTVRAENLISNGNFGEGAETPAFWGAPNPAKGIAYSA